MVGGPVNKIKNRINSTIWLKIVSNLQPLILSVVLCLYKQRGQKMHKIIISSTFVLFTATANAATRCIPFDNSISCTATNYPAATATDATSKCTISGKTVNVHMIGICASNTGKIGTVADTINISQTPSENTLCWCRMVSPATSKWIAYAECMDNVGCGRRCQLSNGTQFIQFRSALFNNLI